ncbi:8a503280-3575-45cf-a5e3-6c490363710b-CDS [Sclerotinia trifoliorum]|uniref:8a503280-3575-45cf-a5e3-6c490363710b-CDS n=1 Tax=Sclerotinia trifoliorum TaxID=28548 RepID=A0A8H2W1Z3_9HELO|nr:8a503280-3575-45cf-a5e3-6c490363710b-CDS [Sclerotinia trifoliorum]
MGLPYSKQIRLAFTQSQTMMQRVQTEVTPLVAAGYPLITSGFEVLKTTKNIAILLAVVQVYTAIMLTVILGVLVMLLVEVNPELEGRERWVTWF